MAHLPVNEQPIKKCYGLYDVPNLMGSGHWRRRDQTRPPTPHCGRWCATAAHQRCPPIRVPRNKGHARLHSGRGRLSPGMPLGHADGCKPVLTGSPPDGASRGVLPEGERPPMIHERSGRPGDFPWNGKSSTSNCRWVNWLAGVRYKKPTFIARMDFRAAAKRPSAPGDFTPSMTLLLFLSYYGTTHRPKYRAASGRFLGSSS